MGNTKILIPVAMIVAVALTAVVISKFWKGNPESAQATTAQTLSQTTDSSQAASGLTNPDASQSEAAGAVGDSQQPAQQQPQPTSQIDPSTFGQYEKYKNNNQALFADVQKGTGTQLTANHKAAVVYKGWLTNGKVFDQSRADSAGKLQPFTFTLGAHQVITGWEQGMAGMKAGGTRLLIIPPSVGYGSTPTGSIPANSVLVFEVQLLAVQ